MRFVLCVSLAFAASLGAQTPLTPAQKAEQAKQRAEVRASYAKREVRIRMRDGTQLFTSIYVPRDTTRRYPILLQRTPYGVAPYGRDSFPTSLGPWKALQDDKYIFVNQDVRGRYMSEGYYSFMTPHLDTKNGPADVDESTDTYDTIDWLIKNVERNNARVGTWGTSAPGFFVAAGMIDAHPAHKAAMPSAPMIDWWLGDDRHHNGAFTLAQTFNFISGFDQPREGPMTQYPPKPPFGTTDGYNFHLNTGPLANYSGNVLGGRVAFWDSIAAHPNYDAYWQKRSIWQHEKNIKPAVLIVGGWYDAEDRYGMLKLNESMTRMSPATQRTLVLGPWWHGGWTSVKGDTFALLRFGSETGTFFRDSIGTPFFACALKQRCTKTLPKVLAFETGANRWRTFDEWPPAGKSQNLYLGPHDGLSGEFHVDTGSVSYISDPSKPVPYTQALSFGYWRDYPTEDQRFATRRPDVASFRTAPLRADYTIGGPIQVTLHVATSGTDADFIVKLIDIYPDSSPAQTKGAPRMDGYEQLVFGNVFRMRWRHGFSTPEPMVANQRDSVTFTLEDILHTFKVGHRMMVHVQSTWFPLIDRNPQTYVPNIFAAKPADFVPARMTVFHGGGSSRLVVTVPPN